MSRPRRTRSRAVVLALAGVLVTAACGSTVPTTGSGALDGGLGSPAPAARGPAVGAPASGHGGPGSGGPSGTGGGSTSGSSLPTGGSGDSPGVAGALPMGPGVTASTIAIGIPYCNDCAAGNATIGAAGEDPGDTRRYFRAALDDVNSRGGVLGRTLVPVFHEGSVNDTNFDSAAQAACETFTKDHKVLLMSFRGHVAYECAKKAGILVLGTGDTGPAYRDFPNLFAPGLVRLERLFELTVKSMVRSRWHKPDATWRTGRIGLITWDDPQYRYAMDNGYLKGMRESGLKATDVRYISVPQSVGALADASAAISSAVLAFQQQGIDHVFIGDGPAGVFVGTGLTFLFLQNAKSQRYYPRYGFNSYNGPDYPNHPKDELVGMLAIDSADTQRANDQGIALNPGRERCLALMRKRGLPVGQEQTQGLALDACGLAWFAEAVLERATTGTTLPRMIAAAESLGTAYRSPISFGDRMTPGQHDSAALFRALRYDEGCSCIVYTSKPFEP